MKVGEIIYVRNPWDIMGGALYKAEVVFVNTEVTLCAITLADDKREHFILKDSCIVSKEEYELSREIIKKQEQLRELEEEIRELKRRVANA